MEKRGTKFVLICLFLIGVYILAREAALVSGKNHNRDPGKMILVDAGHGGTDPGMIGVGGLKEKEINLEIANRLKKVLEEKGYYVVMTRKEDKGLYDNDCKNQKVQDLQRRIGLIGKYKPLLCVSIHQNSYQDPEVYGPQVFYYEDSIQGKELAGYIQDALNTCLDVTRPRAPKGNRTYYLLKRSESVLNIVECGFLTNPEEAELLQTSEYQQKVAYAVALGIDKYLKST